MSGSIDEEVLAAYLRGDLDDAQRRSVDSELDRDPRWLAVLAVLARDASRRHMDASTSDGIDPPTRRLRAGDRLGPYVVLERLGRGGMAAVHAARDERLHRVVALKVLDTSGDRLARALVEARAIASLTHGNIVRIFDAVVLEDLPCLVMERLHGDTVSAWRRTPRTWQQVLGVFAQAAHGLCAVHDAGLVHRDVKPSNLFVTDADRVVVIDFGLVTEPDPSSTSSGAGRTQRQAVGTLAYMPPEQRRGDPPGPAADQFAWAIAFAETLTGRAPPASAVAGRSSGAPPATGRPPRALTRLLSIATRPDARQRWSSMHEITAQLDAIERRSARRLVPVTVVVAAMAGALTWWSASSRDACDASQVVAWDELRRERLATELPSGGPVIAARIDERVGRLREQWSEACIADDQTRAVDLRMSCLELTREEIDVLLHAMEERPEHAPDLVAALPDLARCRNADRGEPPPSDPVTVARWLEIHRSLADVRAWQHGGRVGESLARADELLVEARAIEHGTTIVQVQLARGHALTEAGRYEEAAAALREAAELGQAHHADDEVAAAYADLVWVVGYKQAQAEAGRELSRSAAAWAPRTARPEHHEIQWRRAAGWLELEAGDAAAAMLHFDAALALAESWSDDGSRSDQLAMVLNGIGAAAMTMADLERAEEVFRRAASSLATTRGRDQWQVAQVENNLAAVLRGRGRVAEAEAIFAHTIAVFERAFGPAHPLCGQTRLNVAVLALDRGDAAAAIAQAEAALEILVRTGGPEDAMVGKAHALIGNARVQNGEPELAVISLERALDIERVSLGAQHTSVGISETTLGSALYDAGRPADAIGHHRAAREIFERALGADHPHLAYALVNEALCHRALHDDAQAEPLLVRALEISDDVNRPDAATKLGALWLDLGEPERARDVLERAWSDDAKVERAPGLRGSTAFALARARAATGDEAGARRIALVAAGLYAEAADDDGIARVQTWLDELKPGSR